MSLKKPPQTTFLEQIPSNAEYGQGSAFRHIHLQKKEDWVAAHLRDTLHEMRVLMKHDGEKLVSIDGEFLRYPTNLCPGAVAELCSLKGTRLGQPMHQVGDKGIARSNCTHMFDLAALSIAHALRPEDERHYHVQVPDLRNGKMIAEIKRDDEIVHRWTLDGNLILEPANLAGLPAKFGFFRWAADHLKGDALEAAIILAKTCFIADGRKVSASDLGGLALTRNEEAHGICYAYQPERIEGGYYMHDNRRETDNS